MEKKKINSYVTKDTYDKILMIGKKLNRSSVSDTVEYLLNKAIFQELESCYSNEIRQIIKEELLMQRLDLEESIHYATQDASEQQNNTLLTLLNNTNINAMAALLGIIEALSEDYDEKQLYQELTENARKLCS